MKHIGSFLLIIITTLLLTGCSKFLDYNENTFFTKDLIFDDFPRTQYFLTTIYSHLPNGLSTLGGAMRASATDDAVEENEFSPVQIMVDGRWSPTQLPDNVWGDLYKGIRSVNLFLKETKDQKYKDQQYNDNYAQVIQQFNYYPYEARFLRAFFYFELIERYGDVPLVTTLLTPEEANKLTRTAYDKIMKFIVNECDTVSKHLPLTYKTQPGAETGRATKGVALALKARVLLYAASPLHNPTNDINKWVTAAKAAKDVIDMNYYSLDPVYQNVVNNLNSPELIYGRRDQESNSFESRNFPIGFEGGHTGTCPTQNLVDAYEMQSTGKPIDENNSGYDSSHPYVGRDPRFYATILYNGVTFKNSMLQIWDGGENAPPKSKATKTGYYLKKYIMESISFDPLHTTTQLHLWVLFRYSEILLNYAEAMNEAFGPYTSGPGNLNMTAIDAVNKIRNRVSMPDFPSGLTKPSFRKGLRNERRVELAFEGQRFWDIRRWKIGDSTENIYGVEITKDSNEKMHYSKKMVTKHVWDEKMNLYPISQNELYVNENLTQNPGW